MPCFVCEEPGHTIRTCRHKYPRGAKIFHEIKSTLLIQNITNNPPLLNRGIGLELNKLVVNDLDCLSHFLNISVNTSKLRKIRIIHMHMFQHFEEIEITDRLRNLFTEYEGTSVVRSYQQMAVDRIDIRRANRANRIRAQRAYHPRRTLTRQLAIMYQENQQLIQRPEIDVSPLTDQSITTDNPDNPDECPICQESSLIQINKAQLQCGHSICCQCMSKSINQYVRTTYVSCCLCRANSEKITVYTEENKNVLEKAKQRRQPFLRKEQEDSLFAIAMRTAPPEITTREEFIDYLINEVRV